MMASFYANMSDVVANDSHPDCRATTYTVDDTKYRFATSLLDSDRYGIQSLSDLYHGRWGVENQQG